LRTATAGAGDLVGVEAERGEHAVEGVTAALRVNPQVKAIPNSAGGSSSRPEARCPGPGTAPKWARSNPRTAGRRSSTSDIRAGPRRHVRAVPGAPPVERARPDIFEVSDRRLARPRRSGLDRSDRRTRMREPADAQRGAG